MIRTGMETPIPGKDVVMNYINQVDQERENEKRDKALHNSPLYKERLCNKEREKGKEECLRYIIKGCYRNSLPLSDEYRAAHCNDIDAVIDRYCPDGVVRYFTELSKKGKCSDRCRKLMESVSKEVDRAYVQRQLHPDKYNEEDFIFQMDPEMKQRMDYLAKNMELDDISDLVRSSVKSITLSEVQRAREEKEKDKALELELANDLDIQSESAIDDALKRRGYLTKKIFKPSLFQSIMINKSSQNEFMESYTYHALEEFGMDTDANHQMYHAFVESVKEYTWYTLESAVFRNEPYTQRERDMLIYKYSTQ